MRESNTKFSLSHINLSKLVNLLTFALFFRSLHENPSLSLFLSSLVCIHLGYLRTDISGECELISVFT